MIRNRFLTVFNVHAFVISGNTTTSVGHCHLIPPISPGQRRYSTHTSRKFPPKDLYAVIDVSPFATQSQIKESYYRLSMKYHPDHNQGNESTETLFKELNDAYSILGKSSSRRNYDKGLLRDYPVPHHVKEMKHRRANSSSTTASSTNKSSRIYDFAAFNRGHYGDILKRSREFEKRRKIEENMFRQSINNRSNYLYVVPTTLVFAFFFINEYC